MKWFMLILVSVLGIQHPWPYGAILLGFAAFLATWRAIELRKRALETPSTPDEEDLWYEYHKGAKRANKKAYQQDMKYMRGRDA